MATKPNIVLPDRLVTRRQLRELRTEVETIIEQAVQGSIRKEQTGATFGVNKPSQLLQEMMVLHDMTLTIESLKSLQKVIQDIDDQAVLLRVVLSAEANADVKSRIVRWFRTNMNSPVLMRFGIQPAIAGGCIVYTPNHRYDFSLRTHILESDVTIRGILDKV